MDSDIAFPARLKQAFIAWHPRAGFPTTLIDNHPVDVVQVTAGETRAKFFLDKQTGLLSRMVRFSKTIVGPSTEIDYSGYREVAGVKIPFEWRLTWTDGQSTYKLENVQPNVAIDPGKFAKPVPAAAAQNAKRANVTLPPLCERTRARGDRSQPIAARVKSGAKPLTLLLNWQTKFESSAESEQPAAMSPMEALLF